MAPTTCREVLTGVLVFCCCFFVAVLGGGLALTVLAVTNEITRALMALGVLLAVAGGIHSGRHRAIRHAAPMRRIQALDDPDDDHDDDASAFL